MASKTMTVKCKDCVFYVADNAEAGTCHRYPIAVIGMSDGKFDPKHECFYWNSHFNWGWPLVAVNEWCGEWRAPKKSIEGREKEA